MKVTATPLPGVLLLEPQVYPDERGFFFESFSERRWRELTGLATRFVQHGHSRSRQGVVRGLHYQLRQPQGKLVRAAVGEVFDVAVDLRRSSPTFGRWHGEHLSADNRRQLWIPEGFAHGFLTLSETADVLYLSTDVYAPDWERVVRWDDPDLAIAWPASTPPILSHRDREAPSLREADTYP